MLKEIETEETIDFLSLVAFQLGGGGILPPGYAYGNTQKVSTSDITVTLELVHDRYIRSYDAN